MSIVSFEFLLFVISSLFLYCLSPQKVRPYLLSAANIVFYSFFGAKGFLFLFFCILTVFFAAVQIEKAEEGKKKTIFLLTVIVNAAILVYVKFADYVLLKAGELFGFDSVELNIIVPLGIAFYTLQAISYLADVYKGKYPAETNFVKFVSYMTFFPIIMQGPISKYDQLADQLFGDTKLSYERMVNSLELVLWGLFKKMVIADRAAVVVNEVFTNYTEYTGITVLLGVFLYSIQLYTDFSGCVDICRGTASAFGVELIDNFNHPYFAVSIKDFWRRWHLSLSTWLKDYIYIPLGGSRVPTLRKWANILTVFLVSGLWHGVGVHYIVWGLMHGLFQVIGDATKKVRAKINTALNVKTETFSFRLLQMALTFLLVSAAWLMFRADGLRAALYMYRSIFKLNLWGLFDGSLLELGLDAKEFAVLSVAMLVLLFVSVLQTRISIREELARQQHWMRYVLILGGLLSVLVFGYYGPEFNVSQFIYMQF